MAMGSMRPKVLPTRMIRMIQQCFRPSRAIWLGHVRLEGTSWHIIPTNRQLQEYKTLVASMIQSKSAHRLMCRMIWAVLVIRLCFPLIVGKCMQMWATTSGAHLHILYCTKAQPRVGPKKGLTRQKEHEGTPESQTWPDLDPHCCDA